MASSEDQRTSSRLWRSTAAEAAWAARCSSGMSDSSSGSVPSNGSTKADVPIGHNCAGTSSCTTRTSHAARAEGRSAGGWLAGGVLSHRVTSAWQAPYASISPAYSRCAASENVLTTVQRERARPLVASEARMAEYDSRRNVEHSTIACSMGSAPSAWSDHSHPSASPPGASRRSPSRRTLCTPRSRSAGRPTAQERAHAARSSANTTAPSRSSLSRAVSHRSATGREGGADMKHAGREVFYMSEESHCEPRERVSHER